VELLGNMDRVKSRFSQFGDGFSVGADRCTICTKFTIGSRIMTHLIVLIDDEAHVEAHFGPFGEC
jgi:hypothetical protein